MAFVSAVEKVEHLELRVLRLASCGFSHKGIQALLRWHGMQCCRELLLSGNKVSHSCETHRLVHVYIVYARSSGPAAR